MDGIQGPLTTPTKFKFGDVLEMVRMGYKIYQVNPYDHNEKVRVTVTNINDIKFKTTRSKSCVQRKLNREIQEMNKPILVDVITKESKTTDNKTAKENVKQNKHNDFKSNDDVSTDAEKIDKPDDFTK
jgi:hypothetical protein